MAYLLCRFFGLSEGPGDGGRLTGIRWSDDRHGWTRIFLAGDGVAGGNSGVLVIYGVRDRVRAGRRPY